jgi:hypothetical protein
MKLFIAFNIMGIGNKGVDGVKSGITPSSPNFEADLETPQILI